MRLFNVSTGMAVKNGSGKAAGGVLCLAFEPTGAELWAGDSKVSIDCCEYNIIDTCIIIHCRDRYSLTF